MPKTMLSGTAMAATEQRQPDRRERVGIGERGRDRPRSAVRAAPGEDDAERQQQEQDDEASALQRSARAAPRGAIADRNDGVARVRSLAMTPPHPGLQQR